MLKRFNFDIAEIIHRVLYIDSKSLAARTTRIFIHRVQHCIYQTFRKFEFIYL